MYIKEKEEIMKNYYMTTQNPLKNAIKHRKGNSEAEEIVPKQIFR